MSAGAPNSAADFLFRSIALRRGPAYSTSTEQQRQVVVEEDTVRIESLPDGAKPLYVGVKPIDILSAEPVQFSPVRTPTMLAEECFAILHERSPIGVGFVVNADRHRLYTLRRTEQ